MFRLLRSRLAPTYAPLMTGDSITLVRWRAGDDFPGRYAPGSASSSDPAGFPAVQMSVTSLVHHPSRVAHADGSGAGLQVTWSA